MHDPLKQIDTKELELPETVFIRHIENKVFQSIVLRCLSQVEGVETLEGNLFTTLLGDNVEGIKGIHVDQDQKSHAVNVRIEINVAYGVCIPDKAEEIQNKILEEISQLTGLHVGGIHVIFKGLISDKDAPSLAEVIEKKTQGVKRAECYNEEF